MKHIEKTLRRFHGHRPQLAVWLEATNNGILYHAEIQCDGDDVAVTPDLYSETLKYSDVMLLSALAGLDVRCMRYNAWAEA